MITIFSQTLKICVIYDQIIMNEHKFPWKMVCLMVIWTVWWERYAGIFYF